MSGLFRSRQGRAPLPPLPEQRLPLEILAKAPLRGYEYAWRLGDIPNVLAVARTVGLASPGGQVQFRVPGGTCERAVESMPRRPGEPWAAYVNRCVEGVLAGVNTLPSLGGN